MAEFTAREFLDRVHEVAVSVGWQAGVGGMEVAGLIISCLHANPEQLQRFMSEGAEILIDQSIAPENGSLTYHARDGRVVSPAELRTELGKQQ